MTSSDPGVDLEVGLTERLLADAGVEAGMRVLDFGCGLGRVTRMLAERVGPDGAVVGLDRDPAILDRARAESAGLGSGVGRVSFVAGELAELDALDGLGEFDAIVGRRVLMYVPEPDAVVAGLARRLRPGGRLICQELDATMVPASTVPLPLHRQVHRWIWATVEAEGADPGIGLRLPGLLAGAGLVVEGARAEGLVETAGRRHHTGRVVAAISARIVARGVATLDEIQPATLDERLAAELARHPGASFVGDVLFSVWARKPG